MDSDSPVFLLENVDAFCRSGCFDIVKEILLVSTPETLKFALVQLLLTIVSLIRSLLNVSALAEFIAPLRDPVFKYLYLLSEEDMKPAEFVVAVKKMWETVKIAPTDTQIQFDKQTFDLAMKYLTGPTLTGRISGLKQISAEVTQITVAYSSLCSLPDSSPASSPSVIHSLADWITQNQLVEKLFGPSLHVELVKLSYPVLNFLATENYLTLRYLDSLWGSAQLKHSSHAVYSLLADLSRSLNTRCLRELLRLVSSVMPHEQSSETVRLAYVLIRAAWGCRYKSDQTSKPAGDGGEGEGGNDARSGRRRQRKAKHVKRRDSSSTSYCSFDLDIDGIPLTMMVTDPGQVLDSISIVTQPSPTGSSTNPCREAESTTEGVSGDLLPLVKKRKVFGDDAGSDWLFGNVCSRGNTLLWDLLQDDCVCELPDGLTLEVEACLGELTCSVEDDQICQQFVESCLDNLANHRTVVFSLQLLSKIFTMSHKARTDRGAHDLTRMAEANFAMMERFFTNLTYFTKEAKEPNGQLQSLHSYEQEVKCRLDFLMSLFHRDVSEETLVLTLEQVDILWSCLVSEGSMANDALSWFLQQVQNPDYHALSEEAIMHLFFRKMPHLEAVCMSMTGLRLLQQLFHAIHSVHNDGDVKKEADKCGLSQIWLIALHAYDQEVGVAAMNYVNSFYMTAEYGSLDREEEFIRKCMNSLVETLHNLDVDLSQSIHALRSGLTLLKSHLETFSVRYCFYLRKWKVRGCGFSSHFISSLREAPVKVQCQVAGKPAESKTFELLPSSYVAELRAEIEEWLGSKSQSSRYAGAISFRIVASGHELTVDLDGKTLAEVGVKTDHKVYVSLSPVHRRQPDVHSATFELALSQLPEPKRDRLPMAILALEPNFTELFRLVEELEEKANELDDVYSKRELLSLVRMTWDIVSFLPTSVSRKENLFFFEMRHLDGVQVDWDAMLDSRRPFQLLYGLQIVEQLLREKRNWKQSFIDLLGLEHLVNILKSGNLEAAVHEQWNEWNQKCMAFLLRLVSLVGQSEKAQHKSRKAFSLRHGISSTSSSNISTDDSDSDDVDRNILSDTLLQLLNGDSKILVYKLMSISYQAARAATPDDQDPGSLCADVVAYALGLLRDWYLCCPSLHHLVLAHADLQSWLRALLLGSHAEAVRDKAHRCIFGLCLRNYNDGGAVVSRTGSRIVGEPTPLLNPLLQELLSLLTEAETYSTVPRAKDESFVSGCHEYFYLVVCLIDVMRPTEVNVDWFKMATELVGRILKRPIWEEPRSNEPDQGLVGLIRVANVVLRVLARKEAFPYTGEFFQTCLFSVADKRLTAGCPPKCKNQISRTAAFEMLETIAFKSTENFENVIQLLSENQTDTHYPWYYSPVEDVRSDCGYVGLINLGATCYLASCLQQLFMMPDFRKTLLEARMETGRRKRKTPLTAGMAAGAGKYFDEFRELQKLFCVLEESERKAYNPRSLCKIYTMEKEALNPCEQKDMTEFFTDLISKLEEMTPELRTVVQKLFRGVMTNNVVSLDCGHVSQTSEYFYSVRCPVENMKDLHESLAEVTVKDTLEGDNMYTCSTCGKKVRAEKRACFKVLPKVLCINTMRYTFNMVTMAKEKVNTHFMFPLRINMRDYCERHLMDDNGEDEDEFQCYEYELVGVLVHTGTADGGHYYSYIRDRIQPKQWYLFNDAEVKPFDPSQIPAECYGGEMKTQTYDSRSHRFMDFSFEKSHSAYMLFYECCPTPQLPAQVRPDIRLPGDIVKDIWRDNQQLLRDQLVFDDLFGQFIWQLCNCGMKATALQSSEMHTWVTKLGMSFVFQILVHSKDARHLSSWSEWLQQQLELSPAACTWFLLYASEKDDWLHKMLLRCPTQNYKQMFIQLVLRAMGTLRNSQKKTYLQPFAPKSTEVIDVPDVTEMGAFATITVFIRSVLSLMEKHLKPTSPSCSDVFQLLNQVAQLGKEEQVFLVSYGTVARVINFYSGTSSDGGGDACNDADEMDDEVVALLWGDRSNRPLYLEHMVSLAAVVVEASRHDKKLRLPQNDMNLLIGKKELPFLYQQIKDSLNLRKTAELVLSLSMYDKERAVMIIEMLVAAVCKLQSETSMPFLKLMAYLVEISPPFTPLMTGLVLEHIWTCVESNPVVCLEWLISLVTKSQEVRQWMVEQMSNSELIEEWLLRHGNNRVRTSFALLLANIVPTYSKQSIRSKAIPLSFHQVNASGQQVVQALFRMLLGLLPKAIMYLGPPSNTLVAYFQLMTACLLSKAEKLMFTEHFLSLWHLFQKLSPSPEAVNVNKQAVVDFWFNVSKECNENIDLIVKNPSVSDTVGWCYILSDSESQDVVNFNNLFLPSYYGLLRLCCERSATFSQRLSLHQNMSFAFKQFMPNSSIYPKVFDELLTLLKIFAGKRDPPSSSSVSPEASAKFRAVTMKLFLTETDGNSSWNLWLQVMPLLLQTMEDCKAFLQNRGLQLLTESVAALQQMYIEATACNVTKELNGLLGLLAYLLKSLCPKEDEKSTIVPQVAECWKERMEFAHSLLNFLNPYTPSEIRDACIEILICFVHLFPADCIETLLPVIEFAHQTFHQSSAIALVGPFFPKRQRTRTAATTPSFSSSKRVSDLHMHIHPEKLDVEKGVDLNYDRELVNYFLPYHRFVDLLIRKALEMQEEVQETVVNLSALLAIEGAPLHFSVFAELWTKWDSLSEKQQRKLRSALHVLNGLPAMREYCELVLSEHRTSLSVPLVFTLLSSVWSKVCGNIFPGDQWRTMVNQVAESINGHLNGVDQLRVQKEGRRAAKLLADMRALGLLFEMRRRDEFQNRPKLKSSLEFIGGLCRCIQAAVKKSKATAQSSAQQEEKLEVGDSPTNTEEEDESDYDDDDEDDEGADDEGEDEDATVNRPSRRKRHGVTLKLSPKKKAKSTACPLGVRKLGDYVSGLSSSSLASAVDLAWVNLMTSDDDRKYLTLWTVNVLSLVETVRGKL